MGLLDVGMCMLLRIVLSLPALSSTSRVGHRLKLFVSRVRETLERDLKLL